MSQGTHGLMESVTGYGRDCGRAGPGICRWWRDRCGNALTSTYSIGSAVPFPFPVAELVQCRWPLKMSHFWP